MRIVASICQRLLIISRKDNAVLRTAESFSGCKAFTRNHVSEQADVLTDYHLLKNLAYQRHLSTGIHDEQASPEYAKSRKASLENEFGNAIESHGSKAFSAYYHFGPFLAIYRAVVILSHVAVLSISHFFVKDIHKRAAKFRRTLIHLGPFYIKLGQALSTRPDILPNAYCQELAKLQDKIPPFPTKSAIACIEHELGSPISRLFTQISPEPVAAASLGQVYKAQLQTGEVVAVKVQRPGMPLALALDAHLIHIIGGHLKHIAKAHGDLLSAVNEMVRHMFDEIDYVLEAQNAERFSTLYGFDPGHKLGDREKKNPSGFSNRDRRICRVKVPKIYWEFTRRSVLTMEWIEGIKLTDKEGVKEANLNIDQLINQGVYCSLRQLLEEGYFHADPHPGNLVALQNGSLAYLDFGMMGDIPRHYRVGLIRSLVHYVNRDSMGLANDFLSLGFIPEVTDVKYVAEALKKSFGNERRKSNMDFQGVINQLSDIMYEYKFSLPPDYALVIRALGSLEGTAKVLDPDFKVLESAYPFIIGRLLSDPDPDMRKILRELLICNDGSIRWHRLERLLMAIADQTSVADTNIEDSRLQDGADSPQFNSWSFSFDMRAVAASTADLLEFIYSGKGEKVRICLARDIVEAINSLLWTKCYHHLYPEGGEYKPGEETKAYYRPFKTSGCDQTKEHYQSKEKDRADKDQKFFSRVASGLRAFAKAVNAAPEVWLPLLFSMAARSEVQKFFLDILDTVFKVNSHKIHEAIWISISKSLHNYFKVN